MDKYKYLSPAIRIAIILTFLALFAFVFFLHTASGFFAGFFDGLFGGMVIGLLLAEITFYFERRSLKND